AATTPKRHHVRSRRMPPDFVLPGGYRADWLAAGTYDRAVGFSFFPLQVTHRIDENIDAERDFVVDTLRYADPAIDAEVIRDFSTSYPTATARAIASAPTATCRCWTSPGPRSAPTARPR